jgi:hypothetical protein
MKTLYFLVNSENYIVQAQFEEIVNYDEIHYKLEQYETNQETSFEDEGQKQDFLNKFLNLTFSHLEYHK